MIGRTIGNYVVRAKVGEGGMGVVYRAEHPQINRRVAIKVLHPGVDRNSELVHRFFNEARAATEIRNEHIVEVLDFGELPDGAPYLVMEWLEGHSLGDVLRGDPRQPIARTARVIRGIAQALKAAHAQGVIHRDLKPDNVFLVERHGDADFIKVLDFGIAKLLQGSASNRYQTQTGAIIGTPAYMSPEQCRGAKGVDTRTDVYSLGVIAYQMLTGRLPFAAEALGELLFKHLTEEPPAAATLQPEIPAAMSAIVAETLRKDPEQRPTLDQLIVVMDAMAGGGPTGVATIGAAGIGNSDGVRPAHAQVSSPSPPSPSPPSPSSSSPSIIASATTLSAAASQLGLERRVPKLRSGRAVVAVILGVSVGSAVLSIVIRKVSAPERNAELQRVIASRAAQVAARAPAEVRVEIRTDPETARLEIDGQKSPNPYVHTGAPDVVPHQILVTLSGFGSLRESITFDRDRQRVLKLVPEQTIAPVATGTVKVGDEKSPPSAAQVGASPTRDARVRRPTQPAGSASGHASSAAAPGYHGSKLKIETDFP